MDPPYQIGARDKNNDSILAGIEMKMDKSPLLDRSNQNTGIGMSYGQGNNSLSQAGLNQAGRPSPPKKENRKLAQLGDMMMNTKSNFNIQQQIFSTQNNMQTKPATNLTSTASSDAIIMPPKSNVNLKFGGGSSIIANVGLQAFNNNKTSPYLPNTQ